MIGRLCHSDFGSGFNQHMGNFDCNLRNHTPNVCYTRTRSYDGLPHRTMIQTTLYPSSLGKRRRIILITIHNHFINVETSIAFFSLMVVPINIQPICSHWIRRCFITLDRSHSHNREDNAEMYSLLICTNSIRRRTMLLQNRRREATSVTFLFRLAECRRFI